MIQTRREFLRHSFGTSAVLSIASTAPTFWHQAALTAAEAPASSRDTILVVIQLSGGNDGLNTIIPANEPAYYELRPSLAIPKDKVLSIADGIGWHPAMRGMADLLEAGQVAIVQGVGYPQPNRSHFESMDIWHTAALKTNRQDTGWLGRYIDSVQSQLPAADILAMHLGDEKQPLALQTRESRVPTIASLDEFQLDTKSGPHTRNAIEKANQVHRDDDNHLLEFIRSSTATAIATSDQLAAIRSSNHRGMTFPETGLGQKLATIYQLIDAGLGTKVYYVTLDGFDTHAKQAAAHEGLLRQLSDAVAAFTQAAIAGGHGDRITTMVFSEFGRRVRENASVGTDHGAAAPVLVIGSKVRSGLLGKHPSLTDLDEGDLRFQIDFRQVYASLLANWLAWDPDHVLGQAFSPIELFA